MTDFSVSELLPIILAASISYIGKSRRDRTFTAQSTQRYFIIIKINIIIIAVVAIVIIIVIIIIILELLFNNND